MGKRSNRGKAYFRAMGQRDNANDVELTGAKLRGLRAKLSQWARESYLAGYHGY